MQKKEKKPKNKRKEQFYTTKVNKQATCKSKSSIFIEFAQYESQNKY